MGCNNNMSGSKVHIWSRPQHPWNFGSVHPFTGGPTDEYTRGASYELGLHTLTYIWHDIKKTTED